MTIKPESVSKLVTFKRNDFEWNYLDKATEKKNMASIQAEGVAGVWNRLQQYDIALLADEVGTGKTIQALALMTVLWNKDPKARVLVLTPRQAVADQWEREFQEFCHSHLKSDGESDLIKSFKPPVLERLHSIDESESSSWVKKIKRKVKTEDGEDKSTYEELDALENAHLIIGKFSSLSYLDSTIKDEDKVKVKTDRIEDILEALKFKEFDLIVIDEAHYFRNRGSNRYETAKLLFKTTEAKVLLMTATPNHGSYSDLGNMLFLFGVTGLPEKFEQKHYIDWMQKIAVRRFRRLSKYGLTKYIYRDEQALRAKLEMSQEFSNSTAFNETLFFALYQKQLVKLQNDPKNIHHGRPFWKYMEGTEFDPASFKGSGSSKDESPDSHTSIDFATATDQDVLHDLLIKYQSAFATIPSNPKYQVAVGGNAADDENHSINGIWQKIWPKNPSEAEKVLVFTRRIASTKELARQIIALMDDELWGLICHELNIDDKLPESREEFEKVFKSKIQISDDEPDSASDGKAGEASPLKHEIEIEPINESKVFSWFRREKQAKKGDKEASTTNEKNETNEKSTAASRFRRTFEKSYKGEGHKLFFDLDSDNNIFALLSDKHKKLIKESTEDKQKLLMELFRKAIRTASVGMVELFCCHLAILKNSGNDLSYDAFFEKVKYRWPKMRFRIEVEAMIEQFDVYCSKVLGLTDEKVKTEEWNLFDGASPAYAYTGETKNQSVVFRFNSPFFPKVLISTSVLQEGVNLQFNCKTVMHYGHAWTPGDDEQRVGRVDRMFGQIERELNENESASLSILYPYLEKTHDETHLKHFLKNKRQNQRLSDMAQGTNLGDADDKNSIEDSSLSFDDLLQNKITDPDQRPIKDPYDWDTDINKPA